jgi:hypothetical protein
MNFIADSVYIHMHNINWELEIETLCRSSLFVYSFSF